MLALFAAVGFAPAAAQELEIDIFNGQVIRAPVAVVPFGWDGDGASAPLDVASIIAADLYRSGRFDPKDEEDMLQKPTTGAEVDFDDWTILKVEAVVVGKIVQT